MELTAKLDPEMGVPCFPGTGNLGGEHRHEGGVDRSQAVPGCVVMGVLWTPVPLGSKTQGALRSNLMINSGYIGCQMSKNMKQMGLTL